MKTFLATLIFALISSAYTYASQYDGVYEYVHYPDYCVGVMNVSTQDGISEIIIDTNCGEMPTVCFIEESLKIQGDRTFYSGDDYQFNIVFHGDVATVIFSRGNESGLCGNNAFFHGLYRKK